MNRNGARILAPVWPRLSFHLIGFLWRFLPPPPVITALVAAGSFCLSASEMWPVGRG
jgi:hypothetical protein